MSRKQHLVIFLIALMICIAAAWWIRSSGYMDADYYYVMASELASGNGFNQPFLWNYLDDPEGLPHPAFQYWMPLTSLVAALSQRILGLNFRSAQIPFILLAACIPVLTTWIAFRLHGDRRMAIEAGLLAALPGFFLPFWVTTDSFVIYGVIGAFVLLIMSEGVEKGGFIRWLIAGLLVGLAHLTRADGLLFLGLGIIAILLSAKRKWLGFAGLFAGYILVMSPWWLINYQMVGTPLSEGTSRVLWTLTYDELFSYPASLLTFDRWIESGFVEILLTRLNALWMNTRSLLLVNGLVILLPLMILGGYKYRDKPLIRLTGLYLIIVFLAMSLIFPFAGARGGYFHSSMAVMPVLWALAPIGLRQAVEFGVRVRGWDRSQAVGIFSVAVITIAALVTLGIYIARVFGSDFSSPVWLASDGVYKEATNRLRDLAPEPGIVAVNNPPGFYRISVMPAVVIPDGDPMVLWDVIKTFDVDWVLLDSNRPQGLQQLYDDPGTVNWLEVAGTLKDISGKPFYILRVIQHEGDP
ncbi:MAG: hypothetical protein GTO18_18600 [Anaerolineales bacterium]|nr:hypothetical protein [Anaerolineales bacterium]